MTFINVLAKEVRELIAAGEVVERPASVVKELIENSIDAGADAVEVELVRNGLGMIRVSDNGGGIPCSEVKKAFLRHATSKVSDAGDLDSIGTLGFRGEALAAICAVARVRMVTKTPVEPAAAEYRIEAGEEISLDETGAPDGTSIYVSDIFYNVPARMKFLKKDVYEGNAVQSVVEQLAMSRPNIAFRLIRDGKTVLSTPGDGKLFSAVFGVFPRDVADSMIEVKPMNDRIRVWGYISVPEKARASKSLQYFYVNGRYIKSQSTGAAAAEACRGLLMQGRYPSFVINIEMPCEDVDVNVHPAKTEIRFKNDREAFSAIYAAVKIAVAGYAGSFARQTESAAQTGSVKTETDKPLLPVIDAPTPENNNEPLTNTNTKPFAAYVPETAADNSILQLTLEQAARAYEQKNRGIDIEYTAPLKTRDSRTDRDVLRDALAGTKPLGQINVVGELFGTYIVGEIGEEMILIDKHAAHERILYEQLVESGGAGIESQTMLEPVVVSVSREEKQILLDNAPTLVKLGFTVEDFGKNEVAVREMPVYFSAKGVAGAVTGFAVQLLGSSSDLSADETEWLLHSTACRAAIKAGHNTSRGEMVQLVAAIIDSEIPKYCPHGRPVYVMMDKKEMDKRFGRI